MYLKRCNISFVRIVFLFYLQIFFANQYFKMCIRDREGVNGDSSKEDILAILKKYGISETEVTLWGTGTPLREFLWSRCV